jgi:hypothetical protein
VRIALLSSAVLAVAAVGALNSHRAASVRNQIHPAPGASSTDASALSPTVESLGCANRIGAAVTLDADTVFGSARHPSKRLFAWRCTDAGGQRYPSFLQVVFAHPFGSAAPLISTVLGPDQDFHLASVSTNGEVVTVTGSLWAAPPPGCCLTNFVAGTVAGLEFLSSDGRTLTLRHQELVASPCRTNGLRIRIAPGRSTASSAVLRFVNVGSQPCALEGYPSVQVSAGPDAGPVARPELRSAIGTVTDQTAPPVVVLAPRQAAEAGIDSADQTSAGGPTLCFGADHLTVSPPTGGPPLRLPTSIRVCDFQVHPFLAPATP